MEAKRVVVAISDPALARVLINWLRDALTGQVVVGGEVRPHTGDVVLATPSDCDPVAAADYVTQGIQPIILTPIPRTDEMQRYARAGARYLAMSIDDTGCLAEAVLSALDGYSPPMTERAAFSQVASPRSA